MRFCVFVMTKNAQMRKSSQMIGENKEVLRLRDDKKTQKRKSSQLIGEGTEVLRV